jgi:hypothetical protein
VEPVCGPLKKLELIDALVNEDETVTNDALDQLDEILNDEALA